MVEKKLSLLITLCIFSLVFAEKATRSTSTEPPNRSIPDWSMLVYIAADNNLAPYASYNIKDMSSGLAPTTGLNLLVQWDKPHDNNTWRYKIVPGGAVDVGTLSGSEMGYNPTRELVDSVKWVVNNYPAKHYAIILWNHGSGIEDLAPESRNIEYFTANQSDWLKFLPTNISWRGILYDDSQRTCCTNQGLSNAFGQIKQLIGHNVDLVAMDACLMAMAEVAYQIKDSVNLLVASQQTIPGYGFPYSKFVKPLSLNPMNTSPTQLTQKILNEYGKFYSVQQPTFDYTLSTINVKSIGLLKQNIDKFVAAVAECRKVDQKTTKQIIISARKTSISFHMPEYIDLYSFYANILGQIKKSTPKSTIIIDKLQKQLFPNISQLYRKKLDSLCDVVQDGINNLSKVVLQNTTGPVYSGARGISIYYPISGRAHPSYSKTMFAQDTSWLNFIKTYNN